MTEGIAYAFSINSINVLYHWLDHRGGFCHRDIPAETSHCTGLTHHLSCVALLAARSVLTVMIVGVRVTLIVIATHLGPEKMQRM